MRLDKKIECRAGQCGKFSTEIHFDHACIQEHVTRAAGLFADSVSCKAGVQFIVTRTLITKLNETHFMP